MKLAKPNEQDLNGAIDIARILDDLSKGWFPSGDDGDHEFDIMDSADCRKALDILIGISDQCSLMRAAMATLVLCDPDNKVIDPDIEHVDHHPEVKEAMALKERIDSFFTQEFTGGMKIKKGDQVYDVASADFEEGLVAYSVDWSDDLQWARWENVELIKDQAGAA
ncbi:hypothetical protein [Thalassolituus sp. UBA3500]|uniref:hypothetical protein n=1 Tax=Thalassolituus sp. UBA3500 TaxID=1947664 RepID=UPI000C12283A|nr:hypothetical protein [Thalassolituus sp. UBA3500]MBN58707.1 hypothetical protein [Oceanospirillaceae bacterium]|tara:strand:+ start:2647 stop:3144 length:498 start_codon:yes stop_codon:yes gene_type:complete